MKWMLDTDTCIAIIKKHSGALKKLRGKSVGQVGVSSITRSELAFGAASRPIGPLDTLIGSHALALDLVLVTHNTRQFSRVEGLRLEDWAIP